ncbi:hypothetical protein HK102_000895, partial [Quaeritorhiza haematococci]
IDSGAHIRILLSAMKYSVAAALAVLAVFAPSSVRAQCQDTPITGEPSYVFQAFDGVTSTPSADGASWTVTPSPEAGKGYIALHFNVEKCFDLTQYQAIGFTVTPPATAPVSNFTLTFNGRAADCQTKVDPANYADATKYLKASPAAQDGSINVQVPLADFVNNAQGAPFAFKNTEDMTVLNLNPADPTAVWTFSKFTLLCQSTGAAAPNGTSNASPSAGTPTPPASRSATATATPKAGSSALSSAQPAWGVIMISSLAAFLAFAASF